MARQQPEIVSGLIWRIVDDNIVVVSPTVGDVHVLSPTGSVIWQMLAEQQTLDAITAHIVENFEVEPEQAQNDIMAFIQELTAMGLLRT
jgi:PqqD family protein of HPr-rel-A system